MNRETVKPIPPNTLRGTSLRRVMPLGQGQRLNLIASQVKRVIPTGLPTNSPSTIARGIPQMPSSEIPSKDTPAFTKAKSGRIKNETMGESMCSIVCTGLTERPNVSLRPCVTANWSCERTTALPLSLWSLLSA